MQVNDMNKERVSSFPRDALEQAHTVQNGWKMVGEKLSVPNLNMERFLAKLSEAQQLVERAEALKQERVRAIYERNIILSEVWDLTKRVRNSAKATFGDNSDELGLLLTSGTIRHYESR